jgi:hypothetical protein
MSEHEPWRPGKSVITSESIALIGTNDELDLRKLPESTVMANMHIKKMMGKPLWGN